MAVDFRLGDHGVRSGIQIVEVLLAGKMVARIYPAGEGIKIVSAHMEEQTVDEGFAGEVVRDDGSQTFPPVPAVVITFKPCSFYFRGNKLMKLDPPSKE